MLNQFPKLISFSFLISQIKSNPKPPFSLSHSRNFHLLKPKNNTTLSQNSKLKSLNSTLSISIAYSNGQRDRDPHSPRREPPPPSSVRATPSSYTRSPIPEPGPRSRRPPNNRGSIGPFPEHSMVRLVSISASPHLHVHSRTLAAIRRQQQCLVGVELRSRNAPATRRVLVTSSAPDRPGFGEHAEQFRYPKLGERCVER